MTALPPTSDPDRLVLGGALDARRRRLALGFAAGMAVAVAASWLRFFWQGTLRIETASLAFAVSSLLLGAGLFLASICCWKLAALSDGVPRGKLLWWAIAAQCVAFFAVPLTSSDFYTFMTYGQLQLVGKNPLAVGPSALGGPLLQVVASRWVDQPAVYGPFLLVLLRAAAWVAAPLQSPIWGSGAATKLLMLATSVGTVVAAAAFLRKHRPGPGGYRAFVLVAFSPLLAWELSGQGHSDGVLTLTLMLFAWAALEDRELLAVLALAAGTWSKVTVAPVLALYLLFLLRRRGAIAVAYGAAALALGALLFIPYLRDFPGLGPAMAAVRGTRSHSLGDLLALAAGPLGPAVQHQVESAAFVFCTAACAAALAWAVWRARDVPQMLRAALIFLWVWDLTVPLFQPWYATWLLPLAAADRDERWLNLTALYTMGCVLQWTVQIDPVSSVALDLWVVWRAWKLLRQERAGQEPQLA